MLFARGAVQRGNRPPQRNNLSDEPYEPTTVNLKFYQVKNMKIERIDSYTDNRFSGEALFQHGCFLADDVPCEVQIVSDN